MQQHRFARSGGVVGTRGGRPHDDQDRDVGVEDDDADYHEVGDGEGVADGGENGQLEEVGPAAEARDGEARVLEAHKQHEIGEGVQGPGGPHEGDGHPRRPGRDYVNVPQRATDGDVPLQRHRGDVEGRHLQGQGGEERDREAGVAQHGGPGQSE